MARGVVINQIGDHMLLKSIKWFGNDTPDEKSKNAPSFLLETQCLSTWNYGKQMCKIIKDMNMDLARVGNLSGEKLKNQISYATVPYN
jgi:hypothetical protein